MNKIENYYTASNCYDTTWQKQQNGVDDSKKMKENPSVPKKDQIEISEEGQMKALQGSIADKLETADLDENFLEQIKDFREQNGSLPVNWNEVVDPGGKKFAAAYVESILKQYECARNTVMEYYAKAHQDNLSQPTTVDACNYLCLKYTKLGKDLGSPYYRDDMTEAERNMAFRQEQAMLLGGSIIMKDPYAMASAGGCLNIQDVDQIARQAARDKIDQLIQERKQKLTGGKE